MCDCDLNLLTGEVTQYVTDFFLPGILPLHFQRSYSSTAAQDGPLGFGWKHNLALSARLSGSTLTLVYCEGQIVKRPLPTTGEPITDEATGLVLASDGRELTVTEADQNRLVFALQGSGPGLLIRKEDPHGNFLRFEYDSAGRLADLRDTADRHVAFEHDVRGRLLAIRLRRGARPADALPLASFEYGREGDLVAVGDRAGARSRYEYEDHLLTCVTNRVDAHVYFQYDQKRRCVSTWRDGRAHYREIRHHAARQMTAVLNSLGHTTVFRGNDKGQIEEEVDPLGRVKKDVYSVYGPLVVSTGDRWLPEVTTYARDDRVLKVCRDSGVTKFQLNEQGRPIAVTNPAGETEKREYDSLGNLVRSSSPLGAQWRFQYDQQGNLLRAINPVGYEVRVKRGQLPPTQSEEDALGLLSAWEFDASGRPVALEDGKSRRTEIEYDRAGRPARIALPDDNAVAYAYDAEGRLLARTDESKQTTAYQYDADGRLLAVADPAGRGTAFAYDSESNLLAITDVGGGRAEIAYDAVNRPVELTSFDGVTERYVYDERDQVIRVLDSAGKGFAEMAYDDAGRLVRKEWADGNFLAISHGMNGEIVALESPAGVLTYEWDADMRVVKEAFGDNVLEFEYDGCGRRLAVRGRGGREIRYTRDARGRLTAITDQGSAGTFSYEFAHDKTDLVERCRFPSGVLERFRYDRRDRMVRRAVSSAAGSDLTDRQFAYDDRGRLVRMEDRQRGIFEYRYDGGERLLGVRKNQETSEQYGYDGANNLTMTRSGARITIGKHGRVESAVGETFAYDDFGNLTSWKHAGGETRYEWNLAGELVRVVGPNGAVTEFQYDPLGRRSVRIHEGVRTAYAWDGVALFEEQGASGVTEYLLLPESCVAMGMTRGGRHYSCSRDHLGTVTELFDSDGQLAWAMEMSAFGEVVNTLLASVPWPFRFQGQYYDEMTGLCCMGNRYYDPRLGRFLSPDPAGLKGGTNPYLYVPNPVNWINPLGSLGSRLLPCCPLAAPQIGRCLTDHPGASSPCRRRKRAKQFTERCRKNGFPMPVRTATSSPYMMDQAQRIREGQAGGEDCDDVLRLCASITRSFGTQVQGCLASPVKGGPICRVVPPIMANLATAWP